MNAPVRRVSARTLIAAFIIMILLLGGMQLFCIGIIGEYVGRTFVQTKERPIFIAKEVLDYNK